ncbi:hypothetical protein B0H11DRAFT_2113258, partial [Mycena galericulata]
ETIQQVRTWTLPARRCFPSASSVRPWARFVFILPLILYLLLPSSVPWMRPRSARLVRRAHTLFTLHPQRLSASTFMDMFHALWGSDGSRPVRFPRTPAYLAATVTHLLRGRERSLRGRARPFPPARYVGSIRSSSAGPRLLVVPPCLLA